MPSFAKPIDDFPPTRRKMTIVGSATQVNGTPNELSTAARKNVQASDLHVVLTEHGALEQGITIVRRYSEYHCKLGEESDRSLSSTIEVVSTEFNAESRIGKKVPGRGRMQNDMILNQNLQRPLEFGFF